MSDALDPEDLGLSPEDVAWAREAIKGPYTRVILPLDDGAFAGYVQEWPGCLIRAPNLELAWASLEVAMLGWTCHQRALGYAIPPPNDIGERVTVMMDKISARIAAGLEDGGDVSSTAN